MKNVITHYFILAIPFNRYLLNLLIDGNTLMEVKDGAGWSLNAASEMSNVTSSGFWRANINPMEYLGRICEARDGNLVRYNG